MSAPASALENYKVTQSNRLIEASYTLTLNEKRLVLCAASMIDSRKALPEGEQGYLSVRAEDFANLFGLETRHSYKILKDAVDKLWKREIRSVQDGNPEDMRWIYHRKYVAGQGRVEIGFSPTVVPHMTLLNREFTSFQIKHIGNLSSFYAIRMYELGAQAVNMGKRSVTLERLREILDVGDKYPSIKDLRRWVLDPAIEDVNLNTNLEMKLTAKREGRRIVGFDIGSRRNGQMGLPLAPSEAK
ncbi:replication initiation protein [Pseudomonas sp. DCB_CB]|uniref:replication initiation protein n=1 Tax=unclassified Pseudomonas TaxID=196821 RepID=UPI002248DB0D|nr:MULTISPECIES: replication initiation protein [unclassified Pseudomonas]MCX2694483.1 replication initiation protein [Pseudomonas sp. DCB_BZ]MCX2859687.1 replication initiation protein [Pseudomonas sp. DCB_CB]